METVVRVAVIYFVILIGLRVVGKREFSQLSPLELITLMLIPELVSQSLIREDFSITNGIIGITTLFSLVFITSLMVHRSHVIERMVEGMPTVLVEHGRFIEANMNKERITPGEILAEMHRSGIEYMSQVKWAVLEGDGKISIVPEDDGDRAKRGKMEEEQIS